jgi:hypothetical protein
MPTKPFRPTMIEILDTEPFYTKTWEALGTLWGMPLGKHMMTEIQKRVLIAPLPPGGLGNMCTSGGDGIFYRLRAALRGANGMSVPKELGHALMGAAAAGWTLEKIGHALAPGMSPVTVRTVNNLKHATTMANRQNLGERIARLIEAVADGDAPVSDLTDSAPGQRSLGDDLMRFLKPWLRPGTGGGSRINWDPDKQLGCMGDTMEKRPPAIGLAHELCRDHELDARMLRALVAELHLLDAVGRGGHAAGRQGPRRVRVPVGLSRDLPAVLRATSAGTERARRNQVERRLPVTSY